MIDTYNGLTSYLRSALMNFTEIPSKKTYKQIIEQIISLIVNGDLKNGDKLPGERSLAQTLGASRASIREAFRTLEIIGILEVRHGGGTYVQDFQIAPFLNTIAPLFLQNVDLMGDMMDFRIMLEEDAVRAAALCEDSQTIDDMANAIADMESDDAQVAEAADIHFHMSIFAATGNKVFALAGECLSYIVHTSIHTSRTQLIDDKAISQRWLSEHKAIFDAVANHQPDKAGDALRSHLEGVRRYILETTIREATS